MSSSYFKFAFLARLVPLEVDLSPGEAGPKVIAKSVMIGQWSSKWWDTFSYRGGGTGEQSQNKLTSRSVRERLEDFLNCQTRKNYRNIFNLLPDGRADDGCHLPMLFFVLFLVVCQWAHAFVACYTDDSNFCLKKVRLTLCLSSDGDMAKHYSDRWLCFLPSIMSLSRFLRHSWRRTVRTSFVISCQLIEDILAVKLHSYLLWRTGRKVLRKASSLP